MKWIPWTMVLGRAALGPVVMLGERCGWNGMVLAGIVLTALLSDIFDGVLARRWKTDTAALRLADSLADTAFYLCVAGAVGFWMPAVWHRCVGGVVLVLGCEAVRFGFDLVKFGKPASYHSYLAKTWGLVLATVVIVIFATQQIASWMVAAVVLGVLSNAETMLFSALLPVWRHDVKTLAEAWRLRVSLLQEAAPAKRTAGAMAGLVLLVAVGLLAIGSAQAQSLQHVTYAGGTAFGSKRVQGELSIGDTASLIFEGPSRLVIPYDHVISYESSHRDKVHVGLLTEGFWRLVAPWPEAKQVSLSYRDADDHAQVMLLELSRGDESLLVEVLKTRTALPWSRPGVPLSTRPQVAVVPKSAAESTR